LKFQAGLILLGKSKINRGDSREAFLGIDASLAAGVKAARPGTLSLREGACASLYKATSGNAGNKG
jgi:hypothetical protein